MESHTTSHPKSSTMRGFRIEWEDRNSRWCVCLLFPGKTRFHSIFLQIPPKAIHPSPSAKCWWMAGGVKSSECILVRVLQFLWITVSPIRDRGRAEKKGGTNEACKVPSKYINAISMIANFSFSLICISLFHCHSAAAATRGDILLLHFLFQSNWVTIPVEYMLK